MVVMHRWWRDTLFTALLVGLAAAIPAVLPASVVGHAHLFLSLLVVVVCAARGGLVQGLLATILGLALQIGLWGDLGWILPGRDGHLFTETVLFAVEGVTISLLAHFNLLGNLIPDRMAGFQSLVETIPVGLIVHDGEQIHAINANAAKLFGYQPKDLVGLTPLKILTQDSLAGAVHHARLGHMDPCDGAGLHRDGETFGLELAGSTIVVAKQTMLLTAVRVLLREPAPAVLDPQPVPSLHQVARMRELEQRVVEQSAELAATSAELRMMREQTQALSRLLPVCAQCGKRRTDAEFQVRLAAYLHEYGLEEAAEAMPPDADDGEWICGECSEEPREVLGAEPFRTGKRSNGHSGPTIRTPDKLA